jgi:hypothetical protein
MTVPERLENLIDAYLDGELSPTDREELERELRASDEALGTFWRVSRERMVLREVAMETAEQKDAAPDGPPSASVRQGERRAPHRASSKRIRRASSHRMRARRTGISYWIWAGLAACVAVAMGAYLALHREAPATSTVAVRETVGEVTFSAEPTGAGSRTLVVREDGSREPLAVGLRLYAGDRVETVASADGGQARRATLKLEGGVTLDMSGTSCLRLHPCSERAWVEILEGRLVAEVAPQPPERPFVVKTVLAEAEVVGTRFALTTKPESTRLDVAEGKVRFIRRQDSASILVATSEYALVEDGTEFATRSDTPRVPSEAESWGLPAGSRILFQARFPLSPDGTWDGAMGRAPEAAGGEAAVASTPPKEAGPPFFAEIRSPWDKNGYRVGEHTYLRFRYLAKGFDRGCSLKLMFKRFDMMNYGGFLRPIANDRWQALTVHVGPQIPYVDEPAQKLFVGEMLHQLVWMGHRDVPGKGGGRFWLADVVLFEAPSVLPAEELAPY